MLEKETLSLLKSIGQISCRDSASAVHLQASCCGREVGTFWWDSPHRVSTPVMKGSWVRPGPHRKCSREKESFCYQEKWDGSWKNKNKIQLLHPVTVCWTNKIYWVSGTGSKVLSLLCAKGDGHLKIILWKELDGSAVRTLFRVGWNREKMQFWAVLWERGD